MNVQFKSSAISEQSFSPDQIGATSNERNYSFEFTHAFSPLLLLLLRVFSSCRDSHQTFEKPATRWFRRTQSHSLTQPRP